MVYNDYLGLQRCNPARRDYRSHTCYLTRWGYFEPNGLAGDNVTSESNLLFSIQRHNALAVARDTVRVRGSSEIMKVDKHE